MALRLRVLTEEEHAKKAMSVANKALSNDMPQTKYSAPSAGLPP